MSENPDALTEAWYSHAAAVEQKLGTMAEMFSQMVTGLNGQLDMDRDIRCTALANAARYHACNDGDPTRVVDTARVFETYIRGDR